MFEIEIVLVHFSDLRFYEDVPKVDLKSYFGSNEWRMAGTWALRTEASYACCPGTQY